MIVSSTSQKAQRSQIVDFDIKLPAKYLKIVWLDPDKILFFFEDEEYTIMGISISFDSAVTAKKIEKVVGLKYI